MPSSWLLFDPLMAAFLFALGLCLGSFLNVVIYRLPRGLSLLRPGSRCPHCSRPIRARHNVPLLGWLWLRGRCADCGASIPVRYPLIELAGGILVLLAVYGLPAAPGIPGVPWVRSFSGAWLFLSLLAVLFIDLEHRIIPDEISLGGTVLGLALAHWSLGLRPALAGMAAGAGALFLCGWLYQRLRGKPGMGLGDVKLAGMLGAFLGLKGIALTVLLASFLGSILGIGLILGRKGSLSSALPFGTFLAPSAAAAFLWGPRIWAWYMGLFPSQ
jgi:leader peptidase (prepilin peptidase) / N-methyltransferase